MEGQRSFSAVWQRCFSQATASCLTRLPTVRFPRAPIAAVWKSVSNKGMGGPADSRRLYSDSHYGQTMVKVLQSKPSLQKPRAAPQSGRGAVGAGGNGSCARAARSVPRSSGAGAGRAAFLGKAALKAGETLHRARLNIYQDRAAWKSCGTARWRDVDLGFKAANNEMPAYI